LDAIFTVTDSILMADLCRPSRVSGSAAFFQNAARLADARGARRVRNPFCARLEQRVVALHRRRRRHYSFGRLVGSRDRTALSTNRLRYRRILNATFGNAAELIIALMALSKGLTTVVKASLTGSIIGDLLLVLGASALAGGVRFSHQSFNKTAARVSATAMSMGAAALIIPTVFPCHRKCAPRRVVGIR
jgi:hypothetical protein